MTTITIDRAVVEQALEAMEYHVEQTRPIHRTSEAITAIRAALEKPVQEPVAWMDIASDGTRLSVRMWSDGNFEEAPLYLAPPKRKPLTEEEIIDAVRDADLDWARGWTLDETQGNRFATLARAIERAHGIGGGNE